MFIGQWGSKFKNNSDEKIKIYYFGVCFDNGYCLYNKLQDN